uniref:Uncharacterized protein n=1 Tax=Arundo donax TaxID=35708 RepID=A0A0A8ZW25_ARUDO
MYPQQDHPHQQDILHSSNTTLTSLTGSTC